jgi:hypothetical protein
MTLNPKQRQKTSEELISNFEISGLSNAEVQQDLGFSPEQLDETLQVGPGSSRGDVLRLRDYLDRKVLEAGEEPFPYSLL